MHGGLAALVVAATAMAGCTTTSTPTTTDAGAGTTASTTASTSATTDAPAATGYAALNAGTGYGILRAMTLEEWPSPRDVVIYEALPNELSRVAGVITTVAQTPLSHVNLRAVQDKIPNAYIADASKNEKVTELLGRYVKFTVTSNGYTLEAATQKEVDAHFAASRPTTAQTPERDLTVHDIRPLSEIGFEDWRAFGVKAANLATLHTFELANVEIPDGYGVPFSFYEEFMEANGFYDRVREILDDEATRDDTAKLDAALEQLRDDIKDADMPEALDLALRKVQDSFPEGTSIRCRSSTNNEDLPDFNGAGLYDSKTQHPDEGPLHKCIQQIYASVWNLRAFIERDFYRIDHLTTAMGVLLHPNQSDEQANGVAVSTDPVYETPGAYYVNAQLGEDLVTNPGSTSVPEALLVDEKGTVAVITHSNLVQPGQRLLQDTDAKILRTSLEVIQARFAKLYGVAAGSKYAMEIEFKITKAGKVQIKQARRWVFT